MPWGLVDARPLITNCRTADAAIARIAAAQYGLITAPQLRCAGLTPSQVHGRVRRGTLHPVHRGVHAAGHDALGDRATVAAAALAVGPGACVSHGDAAWFAEMLPGRAGPVHVTVPPGTRRRSREGIVVHTCVLDRSETCSRQLISLTTPARTLIDLAGSEWDLLEPALNEARVTRLVTDGLLRAVIARQPRRLGAVRMAAYLDAEADHGFSRSRAETILRGLVRRSGLPPPRRNVRVHGVECDFWWQEAHLNVEVDGFGAHGRRRNFESDRDRDSFLASHGIQVLRFTWWKLTREPPVVVARIAAALAVRRA